MIDSKDIIENIQRRLDAMDDDQRQRYLNNMGFVSNVSSTNAVKVSVGRSNPRGWVRTVPSRGKKITCGMTVNKVKSLASGMMPKRTGGK